MEYDDNDEIAQRWRAVLLRILKAKPSHAEHGFHVAEGVTLADARQALHEAWPAISAHPENHIKATVNLLLRQWFIEQGLSDEEADDIVSEMDMEGK